MDLTGIYHDSIPAFLAEAAATPPMQRLRGVGMNCGCEYTSFPLFAHWQPYSRLDHCLGAALIVWHFTGDPAQTMAALLHDVATPVFSHVVDFLKGDYLTQESTEDGTEAMILGSRELLEVCRRYGIDPAAITDYHRYPIADNDSPKLSADRLEYTLGNIVNFGFGTEETVKTYYDDLVATDTELVFRTPSLAVAFARHALACGKVYVSDEDRYAMQRLAELLGQAVASGILQEQDFHKTEEVVIQKLLASPLCEAWQAFRGLYRLYRAENEESRKIFAKKRFIDPCVQDGTRASALDTEFARSLAAFRAYSFDYWVSAVK